MRKVVTQHTEPYSLYELVSALAANDLQLQYTDEDNNTKTFATDTQAKDVFERFFDRLVLLPGVSELTTAEKRAAFLKLYTAWWSRRSSQWGRLLDAFEKTYDPISNYDRHEEGSIVTEHDIGARSGTDNLTDTYAATTRTVTETPGVTTTEEYSYGETENTQTETPGVTTTLTDQYGATEITETETPRAQTTTTTTPGVVTTTEHSVAGYNSTTPVTSDKTVITPDATNPDVVTVEGTAGTNTTVTGAILHSDTHTTAFDGESNVTVTADAAREDSKTTSFEGFNQTITGDATHTDTHNRSTGSVAAKDTDTQTFDDYHVYGNIGVTTSAQMLTGELELRSALDLITHAVVEFIDLVSVYC